MIRNYPSQILIFLLFACSAAADTLRPNIVYILADDLGYGDVRVLNDRGKIPTPNLDRIASQGMIFTDAHSGSSVCTPTRYGILTGRYAWRTRLKSGVTWGYSPALIDPTQLTAAKLLKQQGYHTACFGKWHLGMDMPTIDRQSPNASNIDWSGRIANSPLAYGFDTFYGISASLDMHPYIWIEDDRFVGAATATNDLFPPANRSGPAHPDFKAEDVLPAIARKTVSYLKSRSLSKPFFAYVPLTSPHTPIVPNPPFQGKSGINAYADFVTETDWAIGQIFDALESKGLSKNTLLIVTSDNGCSPQADFRELAAHGHDPSSIYRGHKADIYEGGHRIPFLVHWPARVEAGRQSDRLICLTDLLATCAELVDTSLPANAGPDSISFLSALFNSEPSRSERLDIVHHSIAGQFSIRKGNWKLALCPGSGGWSEPRDERAQELGLPPYQLYNLEADPAETLNLYPDYPDKTNALLSLLRDQILDGRSTPGPPQANDPANDWPQIDPWLRGEI